MASADDKSYDDIHVMKVDLPRASKSAAADLGAPKMQAVTINNEGKIALNTIPVTLVELETKLGAIKAATPDVPVVVRGDRQTQYEGIMNVLDVLGRLQIDKIGLATQPAK